MKDCVDKITLTEEERKIVTELNHSLYTIEFIEEWINRDYNVFTNALGALQSMGAKGFYDAVKHMAALRMN